MSKFLQHCLLLAALALGMAGASQADDKTCTACHDKSWDTPVLAVYATKHGNKADARTPGCQSCHGTSDNHLKSSTNPADVRYTKNSTNTNTVIQLSI